MKRTGNRYAYWKYIKNYKFNSILVRNFILIFLLFLLPILGAGIFFYSDARRTIQQELVTQNRREATRLRDIVDSHVYQVFNLILNFSRVDEISALLYEESDDVLNTMELIELIDDLSILHRTMSAYGYIRSMYLYSPHNGFILSTNGAQTIDTFSDTEWLSSFEKNKHLRKLWFENREAYYGEDLLTVFWNMYEFERLKGVVLVNLDLEEFGRFIESKDDSVKDVYLYDQEETIFYSSDLIRLGEKLERLGPDFAEPPMGDSVMDLNGERYLVSVMTSELFNFSVLTALPLNAFYKKMGDMQSVLFSILVIGSAAVLLLSFAVSIKVFQPVWNIINHINQINIPADGKIEKNLIGSSEVKYIANAISQIIDTEHEREAELKKRIELLKRAQAVALQSQINPHFLYNTLEGIKWTILRILKKDNPASKMITILSKLLRYSQEVEDSMASIREELEQAELYLQIMQNRYKHTFTVYWEIDPGITGFRIIRLSLQPILENAIYHGIKPKKEECAIRIKGELSRGQVLIEISDNGIGIDRKEAETINLHLKKDFLVDNSHIGLGNVNQRIKLIFGEQYGLTVAGRSEGGTTVSLIFPAITD
jgi:two-component system, sensor histidine kinase YesM